MTLHHPSPVVRRLLAGATSGAVLAGVLLPGAVFAAAGAPPVPGADYLNTLKNVAITGNVLANDKNPGSGTLSVVSFVGVAPSVGTLTIGSNGAYSFTPTTNFTGTANTTYTVSNASKTRTGNIYITVRTTNVAPVANADTLSMVEDVPTDVTANLLSNDTDADGDTIWVSAVSNATGGSVDLTAEVVTFTLTADLCGNGVAGFDYTVTDGFNTFSTAHASVTATCVNDLPVATADSGSGTEDTDVVLSAASLASNDSDIDSVSLTVTGVSGATGGAVAMVGDEITFTPEANLCGPAAAGFDYTVEDGDGGSATGHVSIDLTCVNDNPEAAGDTLNGTEDTDLVADASDLTGNDGDIDGDTLSVSGVSNAMGGSVVLDAGLVTFTPAADKCAAGLGSFDYELSDGNGGTSSASVVVNVSCVNDSPVANDDDLAGSEDTNVVLSASDLATNDDDVDGDTITVTGVSQTTGGVIALVAGEITFTPAANACGLAIAGFQYTAEDGNGGSATGHATIDLECVNDAPATTPDFATVANASGAADYDVIGNDTDTENDTLSLVDVSVDAAQGSASIESGLLRFTPAAAFTGQAVITYTVSDGDLGTTGTLTVTVGPDVTAPVVTPATAVFGKGRVNETAPLKISWSAVDASSGVNLYEVQVSVAGGPWKSVYAGAATSTTKFYPFGKSLVWRVRSTDKVGNTSDWTSSATRKLLAYQNGNTKITKKGPWTKVTSAGSSGTGYAYATVKGNRQTLTFSGRSVLYVAPKTNASGYVKVYVDGTLLGRYSLKRSVTALGTIIASKTWGANGTHTIKIVNDSSKRANLDAFIVLK